MSLHFNHANTVETGSGINGEKLVEASSTKRRTLLRARYGSYLASWFRDVPFQLHSVFPGAFSPKIPCKFVMQIDFQRSDSSCSCREKLIQRILLLLNHQLIRAFFMSFAMTQLLYV